MRVLAVTNLYPNPLQPHRAPFNRHQLRLLGLRHPLRVIAPVAWTDELALARAGGGRLARAVTLDGLPVEHPRYYFPPKVGRGLYGHCFAASVRGAFRRAVREFAPEVVFALDLGLGSGTGEAFGCDLTETYVIENSEYTT